MVVVVTPAVVIVKVVIRSDLIYIVIGCSMCGVCAIEDDIVSGETD